MNSTKEFAKLVHRFPKNNITPPTIATFLYPNVRIIGPFIKPVDKQGMLTVIFNYFCFLY